LVNSEITLTGGFNLNFKQPNIANSMVSGNRTTQTQLKLGLGYLVGEADPLSIKVQTDISDYTRTNISLKWIHSLNTQVVRNQ
jgi:hypothetical protein